MAPIGMEGVMSWFSSPEVGIISLVALLALSITLLALCTQCNRDNAYDVNGTTAKGGANGSTRGGGGEPGIEIHTEWNDHRNMPPNTLERTKTIANQPTTPSQQ